MYRHFRGDEDDQYLEKIRDILGACQGQLPPRPTQLLPHVYQGSQRHAENLMLLRKLGITHVLNTAGFKGPRKDPNANPYEGLNIQYLEFKADDDDSYNMTKHFSEAFRYLDDVGSRGGVCLVHCALGINRSSCVTAAYLMYHNKWPLLETMRFLKSERGLVLTNLGFQRQLVGVARKMRLLDRLPGGRSDESPYRSSRACSLGPEVDGAYRGERSSRSRYRGGDVLSVRNVHVSPVRGQMARPSGGNLGYVRTGYIPRRRTGFKPEKSPEHNVYGSSSAYATFRSYLLGGGN